MSRLYHAGAETGADHAEGLTLVGTTLTYDTGTKRTGTRSWKFSSSAANTLTYTFTGATARRYWACAYINFPTASGLPGANSRILQFQTAAAGVLVSAQLTTTGKLQLLNQAGTQIGYDSATTLVADTWYRVELAVEIGVGSVDYAALRLDGLPIVATNSESFSDSAPGNLVFGWIDDPGTSEVLFVDDLSLNDSVGTVNNSWVGPSAVYLLLPVSDNADGGWTAGAGGTSLFAGVDNTPPAGVASAGTNTSQIGNAVSSTTDNADLNLASYTTAGVAAGDTIAAVYGVVEGGNSSTTGSDTLRISVVSNPAITESSPSIDIVVGTYPTGWNRLQTAIVENPTVTRGTSPVMRVGKNIANVRRANVCFMGLYVGAVTPATAPATYSDWTPSSLASGFLPRAWYRAEDVALADGAAFQNWTDFSGNSHTAVAQSTDHYPVYFTDGPGHRPHVLFSEFDNLLTNISATSNDETIYAVVTHAVLAWARVLVGTSISGGKFFKLTSSDVLQYTHSGVTEMTVGTTSVPATASIIGGTISSTTAGIYHVNGVDQVFAHTDTFSGAGVYYLGSNFAGEYWIGTISELIVMPALVAADREKVEGYLAWRYGLTGSLPGGHPYKTTPPSLGASYAPPTATATAAGSAPLLALPPPAATATGAGLAPLLALPPPKAAATGAGVAPTLVAVFAPPVATASASGIAPSVIAAVNAPKATATGAGIAPSVQSTSSPPLATATGVAASPTLALAPPIATATGVGVAPTVVTTFAPPAATASGSGQAPTVRVDVSAPKAAATGAGLAPSVALSAPSAAATGLGITPAGSVSINAPVATATGSGQAPTVRATFTAPAAAASASASAPTLALAAPTATAGGAAIAPTLVAVFAPPTALASASAIAPTVQVSFVAPKATASGTAFAPTLALAPPTATATGAAYAPNITGLDVTVIAPPTGLATGAASAPAIVTAFAPPTALATGTAASPTIQATITAPAAVVSGDGASPSVRAVVAAPLAIAGSAAVAPVLALAAPTATASAEAYAPAIPGMDVTAYEPPTATATGQAFAPALVATFAPPTAMATGTAIAPSVQALVTAPTAQVSGQGQSPTLQVVYEATPATAAGAANAPTLALEAPLATADATAIAPSVIIIMAPDAAAASSEAYAPDIPGIGTFIIAPPTAMASGAGYAPVVVVEFAAPIVFVAGQATVPLVVASFGVDPGLVSGVGRAPNLRARFRPPTGHVFAHAIDPIVDTGGAHPVVLLIGVAPPGGLTGSGSPSRLTGVASSARLAGRSPAGSLVGIAPKKVES